jgi:hypothetical protein
VISLVLLVGEWKEIRTTWADLTKYNPFHIPFSRLILRACKAEGCLKIKVNLIALRRTQYSGFDSGYDSTNPYLLLTRLLGLVFFVFSFRVGHKAG